MKRLIDGCRDKIGPVPRPFGWRERWKLTPPRPYFAYIFNRPDLVRNHQNAKALLQEGKVAWGVIIQANSTLFQPGKSDAPCMILTSRDPLFDDDVETLKDLAVELFSLKGTEPEDPVLLEIAKHLTSEVSSTGGIRLPTWFTGGRKAFACEMMVNRQNLPEKYLSSNVVPVLVHKSTPAVLLLPIQFWDDDLVRIYREGGL